MSLCGNCPKCKKPHGVYDGVGIYGDFTLCRFCKSANELEDKQKKLADAQLAALSSAPQGWRDIKDAPKDGTYFWACNRIDIWKVYWDGKWYEGDEKSRPFLGWLPFAAAFPPLPAAPATKEG